MWNLDLIMIMLPDLKGGLFWRGAEERWRQKLKGDGVNMIKVHFIYV
jgi:hypothetical protein